MVDSPKTTSNASAFNHTILLPDRTLILEDSAKPCILFNDILIVISCMVVRMFELLSQAPQTTTCHFLCVQYNQVKHHKCLWGETVCKCVLLSSFKWFSHLAQLYDSRLLLLANTLYNLIHLKHTETFCLARKRHLMQIYKSKCRSKLIQFQGILGWIINQC